MTRSTRRTFLRWTAAGSLTAAVPSTLASAAHWLDPESPVGDPSSPDGTGSTTPPTDLRRTFLRAAREGNADQLRELLEGSPKLLGSRDEMGRTAFALAHLGGYDAAGEVLLEHGFEPDAHEAALSKDWDRFNKLVETDPDAVDRGHPLGGTTMLAAALGGAGSDIWRVYAAAGHPNVVPHRGGLSPLQAALRFSVLPIAEMTAASMLSNDADPNPEPGPDAPPLHIAAERGSLPMIEVLIRRGARIDATDAQGRTALDVARIAGQAEAAARIRGHQRIPRTHSSSRTAFDVNGKPYRRPEDLEQIPLEQRLRVVGVSHGDLGAVRDRVGKDSRLAHSVATTNEICVEACAHTGRLPIVEYLLERGAPYSLPTATVLGDRAAIVRLLDQDPLRIHERGAHGFPLLWYPIIGKQKLDITELLLERGAKIEEQHWMGTTALHWACIRGSAETVSLLIENGADVHRVGRKFTPDGNTPLQLAEESENKDVARLLRQHGAVA